MRHSNVEMEYKTGTYLHRVRASVMVISVITFCSGLSGASYTFLNAEQEQRLRHMEVSFVEPISVDDRGVFKSHSLHHSYGQHGIGKRSTTADNSKSTLHYRLAIEEQPIHIVLEPNFLLYPHNLVIERRFSNKTTSPEDEERQHCHFTGHIKGDIQTNVAVSTCNGLTGVIMMSNHHYFIEPLKGHLIEPGKPHPHVLYKTAHNTSPAVNDKPANSRQEPDEYCSQKSADTQRVDNFRRIRNRRQKRSYSREYYIETLVVVDHSMVAYYKDEDINTYIITIMNMVSVLFHEASIGNSINVNIVRILLLDEEQEKIEGLEITHHADNTLNSFCKWQKGLNLDESDPAHHDVAVLITRLNICSRMNEPCSTLGLSQVSGMCQPGRSCNVNEDTGLALAYTLAHEIGHNLGMKHDGINDCLLSGDGEKSYIMFPEFLIDAGRPLVWSNCSRQAVTVFLDRGWGHCLLDEPENLQYSNKHSNKPPGLLYDVNHQCRLQYGTGAEHCSGIENMCTTLWCRHNDHCVTRLEPAAEGTICDWENSTETGVPIAKKWCFDGKCTDIDTRPEAIDGGWAEWTAWTDCSRTCGGGVSISERHCINPAPSHGGKYCIGERKRYSICNTDACPPNQPSFLQVQCSTYNEVPYKSVRYEWEPVATNNPCQLNCKPKNMYFSVMLADMVMDGTPCEPGTNNMCITGKCRKVGCDWKLESNATEDRCGICHGDGTSCKTVKDKYSGQPTQNGEGYVEAMRIPAGARNIRIEEVAEANNYLAVKSENDEYYLNGHWYIQWTGNYNMAGTTVHYERKGNKEEILAPGPIKEPLHIMLLFQSHNPGVTFEYTVPNENGSTDAARITEFSWQFLDWTHCSVSCGGGYSVRKVICTEKEAGHVDDSFCSNQTKPDDKARPCNEHLCPARWWSGPWQHCSVSCGEGGVRQRTVLCVRSLGPEEQMALDDTDCDVEPKPSAVEPCPRQQPDCPSLWRTDPWSECMDVCDTKTRNVICTSTNVTACQEEAKPVAVKPCNHFIECGVWRAQGWSECSKSCGGGVKSRRVECIDGERCKMADRPEDLKPCNEFPCSDFYSSGNNRMMKSSYNRKEAPQEGDKNIWDKLWNLVVGQNNEAENMILKPTAAPVVYNESWHAAEWGMCTASCGTGVRSRQVWCPTEGNCDPELKPKDIEQCQGQPCISWVTGSWSQCSVTCGNGTQERNVQCIDLKSDKATNGCSLDSKPSSTQHCQAGKCESVSAALSTWTGEKCESDSLAEDTCQQLKDRGFCAFRYVSRNCCRLCGISDS